MIPGVIASALSRSLAAPDLVTLASADFVAGVYSDGGVPAAAGDFVGSPELIEADGLHVGETNPWPPVEMIGGLRDALFTGNFTMVLEYQELYASQATTVFVIENADLTDYVVLERQHSGLQMWAVERADNVLRDAIDTGSFGIATHKIALTRTNDRLSFSIDGRSAVTEADARATPTYLTANFGQWAGEEVGNNLNVRSIVVYEPVADASLPGLST